MAITWRNVQAPEQGSSNALFSNGVQTLLGGFGKVTETAKGVEDARKLLEQKANEDVLGQLQAAGVANSVDPALRNVLVSGQLSGLGGKELSALATSMSGQQTTNDNTQIAKANAELNSSKFNEANRQFNIEAALKKQGLEQQGQIAKDQLAQDKDQLAQEKGQFDITMAFNQDKFDYEKSNDAFKNKLARMEAEGKDTSGMQKAYTTLTTSDKFKTATPQEQVLMLTPYMDANTSAKALLDAVPDPAKANGGGNAKGVDDALKPYINDPRYNHGEDQNHLIAAGNQAVNDNIRPEVAIAYMTSKSDSAYWGNWAGGQSMPKYSPSAIIEYAEKQGIDPFIKNGKTSAQGTTQPVSPEGQTAKDLLRPPK